MIYAIFMVQRCEFPIVSKRDIAYFLVGECLSGELTRSVHLQFSLRFFRIGLLKFRGCTWSYFNGEFWGFSHLPGLIRKLKWCFPETMSTASRKPYAPKKRGNFLGTKSFEKLGKLCDGKHPKRKKKNPVARKKHILQASTSWCTEAASAAIPIAVGEKKMVGWWGLVDLWSFSWWKLDKHRTWPYHLWSWILMAFIIQLFEKYWHLICCGTILPILYQRTYPPGN